MELVAGNEDENAFHLFEFLGHDELDADRRGGDPYRP
jgi:hypothetical protein